MNIFSARAISHYIKKEQKNKCIANYDLKTCIKCKRSQEPENPAYVV